MPNRRAAGRQAGARCLVQSVMKLPQKVGDVEPLPHKVRVGPANIVCDHCQNSIRIKLYIQKVSPQKYMDFFTCPHCQTRYNISLVTRTGLKLRAKLTAMMHSGNVGAEFDAIKKRYASMVSEPESRIIKAGLSQ